MAEGTRSRSQPILTPSGQTDADPSAASGASLPEFLFTGLRGSDRLFVMAQNPANNYHWSKPIGPAFTVADLKRAIAILDAAEAMREALGLSAKDTTGVSDKGPGLENKDELA